MGRKLKTGSWRQSDTLVNPLPKSESNTCSTSTGRAEAENEVQIVDEQQQDEYSVENLRRRQSQEPLDTSIPVSSSAPVEEQTDDPKQRTSLSLPLPGSRKLRPYFCLSFDDFSKLSLSPNDHSPVEISSEGEDLRDSPRNPRDIISFRDFAGSSRYSPNSDSDYDYEGSLGDLGNREGDGGGWMEGWLMGWPTVTVTVNGAQELEASGSSEKKGTTGTGQRSPSSSGLSFLKWEAKPFRQTSASASAGSPIQSTTSKEKTRRSKSASPWIVTPAIAASAVTAVKAAPTDVSAATGVHDLDQGHSNNLGETPATSKGKKSKGIAKRNKRGKRKPKN